MSESHTFVAIRSKPQEKGLPEIQKPLYENECDMYETSMEI